MKKLFKLANCSIFVKAYFVLGNFFKYLFKNKIYIVLLLVISFISHWYLFFDLKILNWGDWVYYFNSQAATVSNYNIYIAPYNLGSVGVFANNWIFYLIFYLTSFLGISWDIFTRIFFLIPIVFFTPIFTFLLFRKIFKNDLIAFFGSCIYSFNTFFLKLQLDWITYAFIWWILPALFLSILNYLETKEKKYLIYNSLLVFLGFVYELRIMILVLTFLLLFQIIYLFTDSKIIKIKLKNIFYILTSFFLGILSHSFWLIPLKFGNIFSEVMSSAPTRPFDSFYDILDAFTLHMYSWSQNLVLEAFIKQPIEFRHFLIPLVALIGIVSFKKLVKEKKDVLYFIFFVISLSIFIFLGKQAFEPLGNFYNWAFNNIPLFNLYRESSKFFILIALPLAFFFGYGLFYIYKFLKRNNKILSVFVIIIILFFSSIFNLQHFIDQKIGGMTKGNIINDDYIKLEEILTSDPNFYRILWMPNKPRFGYFSERHPSVTAVDLTRILKDQVGFTIFDGNSQVYSQLLFLLQQNYSDQLLDNMAIRYVILPAVEERSKKISAGETLIVNEIYEHYGERENFVDELDKISYLKKIDIGVDELIVYENKNYSPHIYQTQEKETIYKSIPFKKVDFYYKNPTEYKIFLNNINDKIYLNFSEAYNQEWKIKIDEFNWLKSLIDKNYFLPVEKHFNNDAGLNTFVIDPEYIKTNLSEESYLENEDGSIDIELTLYFLPQSYFYVGLIISGFILSGLLGYLIYILYAYLKKKRKKVKHAL